MTMYVKFFSQRAKTCGQILGWLVASAAIGMIWAVHVANAAPITPLSDSRAANASNQAFALTVLLQQKDRIYKNFSRDAFHLKNQVLRIATQAHQATTLTSTQCAALRNKAHFAQAYDNVDWHTTALSYFFKSPIKQQTEALLHFIKQGSSNCFATQKHLSKTLDDKIMQIQTNLLQQTYPKKLVDETNALSA